MTQANKKRGAPLGNQNAKGHGAPKGNRNGIGHGAPKGNKNGLKHGLYERFDFASMSEDERIVALDTTPVDTETELRSILAFLRARELHMLKRLGQIRRMELPALESVIQGKAHQRKSSEAMFGISISKHTPAGEMLFSALEARIGVVQDLEIKVLFLLTEIQKSREQLAIEYEKANQNDDLIRRVDEWLERFAEGTTEE